MSTHAAAAAATELRESMMALTRRMRRHRPDHGLTLSQLEALGEVGRTGVSTPAEPAARMHVRVQSLTDSINELGGRGLVSRRPDQSDRRRQLVEVTAAGTAVLERDRAVLMLVAPVLRKLANAEGAP